MEHVIFRTVRDERSFLALRPRWEALFTRREAQFIEQSFHWAWVAWETTARPQGRELRLVVGEAAGRIVLILPFSVQRLGPFRIARWLGPDNFGYCDVLVERCDMAQSWIEQAWTMAMSGCDLVRLPIVRMDAMIWSKVQKAHASGWMPVNAPYIDCTQWPDWQTYFNARSQSFRKDCQKSLRLLRKAGAPCFVVVDRADDLDDTLSWMFGRKFEWLARSGLEARTLAREKTFSLRFYREALARGEVLLTKLQVNDTCVAAQIAFHVGDRLDTRMIAWDYAWQIYGVGRLLAVETVRWAFEHGLGLIDLEFGGHGFKYRLTDRDVTVATDVFVAPGPLGRVLLAVIHGRRVIWPFLSRVKAMAHLPISDTQSAG
jgi:CelD/BcsL family acetyltransferase involved in cellulose biosynthesis